MKVIVVDDAPLQRAALVRLLQSDPELEVVATARDGVEALEEIHRHRPQVVVTDLVMPRMDGLELTRRTMAECPTPILVVTLHAHPEGPRAFELLRAGAVDLHPTPRLDSQEAFEREARALVRKVRLAATVRVHTLPVTPAEPAPRAVLRPIRCVGMGASTGGPRALADILGGLPADLTLPILCVQHIAAGFLDSLVAWLAQNCALPVRVAVPGEPLPTRGVLFPPEDHHLELGPGLLLRCRQDPKRGGHRPSIDVTFESLAHTLGPSALGVLLTGMGEDGAAGLAAMRRAGCLTVAQDEASSAIFGMPRRAQELGAAELVMNPAQVRQELIRLGGGT